MDALTTDIEGGAEGAATASVPKSVAEDESENPKAAAGVDEDDAPKSAPASKPGVSALDEMQEKIRQDLEKLVTEKEAEINEMVTVLDALKAEIGKSEIQTESL